MCWTIGTRWRYSAGGASGALLAAACFVMTSGCVVDGPTTAAPSPNQSPSAGVIADEDPGTKSPADGSPDQHPSAFGSDRSGKQQPAASATTMPTPEPLCRVPETPPADTSSCSYPTPSFLAKYDAVPGPLGIGRADEHGAFKPYPPQGCAELVFGLQGGFHVLTAVAAELPETPKPTWLRLVWVEAAGYIGCQRVTKKKLAKVWLRRTWDGRWTSASKKGSGLYVEFPASAALAPEYRGLWLTVRATVLDPATTTAARGEVLVRTF